MNLIAYRLPFSHSDSSFQESKSRIFIYGEPLKLSFNTDREGFIIGEFEEGGEKYFYPFKEELSSIPDNIIAENNKEISNKIFSKDQYIGYVKDIIRKLDNDPEKKIVASRRLSLNPIKNLNNFFFNLCSAYPEAFIYLISTKEFGTWIGASPELLLEKRGKRLQTMSLAGTMKISKCQSLNQNQIYQNDLLPNWNEKNFREQQIVTDYIATIFRENGLKPQIGGKTTKRAGNIQHLMTPIKAYIDQASNIEALINSMSPTPALAGFPKNEALEEIRSFEGNRQLYGGFCGPYFPNGDFRLNVILRCAYLSPINSILFAGGGITSMSDPEEEWQETENKLATLSKFF